jgi:hypothetical protein
MNVDCTGVSFSDALDPNTTLVPGSIQITPIALDDAYNVAVNVGITVNAADGVLANDIDPDHSTSPLTSTDLTAVGLNTTGTLGTVTLNPNGSFT